MKSEALLALLLSRYSPESRRAQQAERGGDARHKEGGRRAETAYQRQSALQQLLHRGLFELVAASHRVQQHALGDLRAGTPTHGRQGYGTGDMFGLNPYM